MSVVFETLDKMPMIKAMKKASEYMYLVGLVLMLAYYTFLTTMFDLKIVIYMKPIVDVLPAVLIIFKIAFTEYREWKRWPLYIIAILLGMQIEAASYYRIPYNVTLMIIGANHVSFRKILNTYLVVVGGIVAAAMVCSLVGIIENLQYDAGERGIRNSYGIIYTTDFAAHIMYLFIAATYSFKDRLRAWWGLVGIGVVTFLWLKTNSRVNCLCLLIFTIIFMLIKIFEGKNIPGRAARMAGSIYRYICIISVPMAASLMLILTAKFSYDNKFYQILLKPQLSTLWSRFVLGYQGMQRYAVNLFGQSVTMHGAGGTTEIPTDYFFIDCSYLYILLLYGFIFFAAILILFVVISIVNSSDKYLLLCIAVIALNSMIDHHFVDLAYNPFILALLAATPVILSKKECSTCEGGGGRPQ